MNLFSTDNLLNLFYNGFNEEQFNQFLAEKISIDNNGGRFRNLNEETFFNILDCFINKDISNLKSNKEIKFKKNYSQISFKDIF